MRDFLPLLILFRKAVVETLYGQTGRLAQYAAQTKAWWNYTAWV